ncbi:MAG: hypothetical protein IPI67_32015 [Myxococcales bacterium]|nr:hypothetical protein [Myxococcales bacterium]
MKGPGLLGVLLGALVSSCGPYIDEVVKERGAKVEAKLVQVRALGEELNRTPLLTQDEPTKVQVTLGMAAGGYPSAKITAALTYAEDLRDLDELGLVYARVNESSLVNQCAANVHTEREPWDPLFPSSPPASGTGYSATRRFDACERLTHLFVLRTRAFARPSPGRTNPATQGQEFDAGFIDVDVLIFDLAEKRRVGGLRVQAESDVKLDGATEFKVEFDLQYNLEKAIVASLKKNAPNVTVVGGHS